MQNLKWVFVFLFLTLIIQAVSADVTFPVPEAIPAPKGNISETREIHQMDTVYWNETINVALVMGWNMKLVHSITGRIVNVEGVEYEVFVDPEIFPVGEWKQWYSEEEPAANLVAFYVEKEKPLKLVSNATGNVSTARNETKNETSDEYHLLPVHVSDLLVAKGSSLVYQITEDDIPEGAYFDPSLDTKAWLFGSRDMLLGIPMKNGTIMLTPEQTKLLMPDTYRLFIEQAGPNTVIEANVVYPETGYPSTTYHIESPFKGVPNLEIGGSIINPEKKPREVGPEFGRWIESNTDDDILHLDLVIQDPSLETTLIDEVIHGNETVNQTFWIVRGYTNLNNGTPLNAILDESDQTAVTIYRNTFKGAIVGKIPGDMREFVVVIPVNYNQMTTGPHFVTVRSIDEVYNTVPRWVYSIPEGQRKPVLQTKYSGGNLYVPAPTPEIIEKVKEVEKIKTVYVTVTPEPTPTPVPPPWYTESPWIYAEGGVVLLMGGMIGTWILWKTGRI